MSDSDPPGQVDERRGRWQRIALGGAGAVALAAAVIVVAGVTATSLVTTGGLESLLLDSERINAIMGASDMQLGKFEQAPEKPVFGLSRPDCLGVISAAQAPTYADSGYTGLRWTAASDRKDRIDHYVAQAVAAFPDIDKADVFVNNSVRQWKKCAGQTVAVVQADKSMVAWTLQSVRDNPPNVTISEVRRDVGWACQRVMRPVLNVVIDATACGRNITDQGGLIADGIAAKIRT